MIPAAAREELQKLLEDRVEFDAPMSRHTSLRVGGPADALAIPSHRKELAAVVELCNRHALPVTVLGAGFNMLVQDGGLAGVVLRLKKLRGIERSGGNTIRVDAGASHATVTRFCVDHGLSGLEFCAGIPGSVGGWVAMNAGIGVREIKDVVVEVEWLDASGSQFVLKDRSVLDFEYRSFASLAPGALITRATFAVAPQERATIRSEIDRLLAHRQSTQPIDIPSCGSVFRNPTGDYAGRLVEAAGLKGERVGDAQISEVHANFIVNLGRATARDVLELIDRAQTKVHAASGVSLVPEVRILGEVGATP